jgi:small-conductance mechanosensitive channel
VNFGPAALEFEIRVFLADILNGALVQNDIRFQVLSAFAREGVVIPSTARAPTEPMREEPAEAEPEAQPAEKTAKGAKGGRTTESA